MAVADRTQRRAEAGAGWTVAREFVARIGRLASGDGWRRRTTPPMTLDPRCRSRPMLIAVTASRNSGARVTNWPAYDASLRQRGSLTVWFTDEAVAAWEAEPRTTPGGQPHYSSLAITT